MHPVRPAIHVNYPMRCIYVGLSSASCISVSVRNTAFLLLSWRLEKPAKDITQILAITINSNLNIFEYGNCFLKWLLYSLVWDELYFQLHYVSNVFIIFIYVKYRETKFFLNILLFIFRSHYVYEIKWYFYNK